MNNAIERVANYKLNNSTFRVSYGDITKLKVDAIVSSDDNKLSMDGGISAAILKAGGPEIRNDANRKVPLSIGQVAVTTAGNLSAKYIFHAITIDSTNKFFATEETIKIATLKSLQLAETLGISNIAFPAIGTGAARFPIQKAAEVMTKTIAEHLLGNTSLELVILSLYQGSRTVNESKINLIYERIAAQMSIYTSSKRLISLLYELKDAAISLGFDQAFNDSIKKLEVEINNAEKELVTTPNINEQLDEPKSRSKLEEASRNVIKMTTELDNAIKQATRVSSQQLDLVILHTKMNGLQNVLNIKIKNLNGYEIQKAKLGGEFVPKIENNIDELKLDITKLEEQLRSIKLELSDVPK